MWNCKFNKFFDLVSYETFNSIERTSKEFEYDQNYTKN